MAINIPCPVRHCLFPCGICLPPPPSPPPTPRPSDGVGVPCIPIPISPFLLYSSYIIMVDLRPRWVDGDGVGLVALLPVSPCPMPHHAPAATTAFSPRSTHLPHTQLHAALHAQRSLCSAAAHTGVPYAAAACYYNATCLRIHAGLALYTLHVPWRYRHLPHAHRRALHTFCGS